MKKLAFLIFFLIIGSFFAFHTFSQDYDPDFNKNSIISDFQMFDYNSMNQVQIQQFLESKSSYLASYMTSDCDGMSKLASQIIYEAAQKYRVNPKYILVTLQKEQSLIQWEGVPPEKRLSWACGYAVCDSCSMSDPKIQKYKGFGKQVDNSAGSMRFYYDSASAYGFIKKANTPTVIDGETLSFISQATANLYTYTPHIAGNYTFWRIWQRYFGDPLSGRRESNASISTEYMLQVISSSDDPVTVKEGETAAYWVEYLNIGTQTWTNNDLKNLYLIDTKYKTKIPLISTNSTFTSDDVIKNDIKVHSQRTSVAPGEVLRITVTESDNYDKTEAHSYMLVYEGRGWFAGSEINFNINRTFKYEGQYVSGIDTNLELLKKYTFTVKYKNIGTMAWDKNTKLYIEKPDGKTLYTTLQTSKVNPGDIGNFVFTDILSSVGTRSYKFSLYKQVDAKKMNKFPSGDFTANTNVSLKIGAQLIEQNIPVTMLPGETRTITLKFKNAGKDKWDKNLVLRAYDKVSPFTKSMFKGVDWESTYAISKIKGTVNSGEDYSFTFKIKAPIKVGKYPIYFQLEQGTKNQEIIVDDTMSKKFIIDVTKSSTPNTNATPNTSDSVRKANGISFDLPTTMVPGEIKTVTLILKNTGDEKWDSNYVLRAYKSISPYSGSNFYDTSWVFVMAIDKIRTTVNPGEKYAFTFKIKAPTSAGKYRLYLQLEYGSKYEEIAIDAEKTKEYSIEIK